MRVALWQMLATAEKDENLATMERGISEAAAAGADLVAFPECAMLSVEGGESLAPLAEPLEGPFVGALRNAARASGIAVIAGVVEAIPGSEKTYNTAVAISARGSLIGAYRKIHMFDAFGHRESDRNQPGSGETLVFERCQHFLHIAHVQLIGALGEFHEA